MDSLCDEVKTRQKDLQVDFEALQDSSVRPEVRVVQPPIASEDSDSNQGEPRIILDGGINMGFEPHFPPVRFNQGHEQNMQPLRPKVDFPEFDEINPRSWIRRDNQFF